ncbi:MAG: TonB-dependent receptor, partial [Pseudomonadales bacterium]
MVRKYPDLKSLAALTTVGAFLLTACQLAYSQPSSGMLEEIIVTAQKRVQSLQDVPISVNVLAGEKIGDAGISKIEDLQAYVPNFTMSETGIGTNIYMRGLGSGINQGFEQSVGLYKDGAYYGRAQLSRAPFLDLERVEVLRGPQNILYGKNSIAGAVSMISARPTPEFEGEVSATFEPEYGEQIVDLILSGPITENLSGRIAHRSRDHDGYIKNLDGGDEPRRDEQTTRLSLLLEGEGGDEMSLIYERSDFDIDGRQVEIIGDRPSLNPGLAGANWGQFLFSLNPLNTFTGADQTPASVNNSRIDFARSANDDHSYNSVDSVVFNMTFDVNDIDFSATTSLVTYDYEELCDCDFTSADVFFVESTEDYEQFSQEVRLTSPGGETVDWIAGLYYQSSDLEFHDRFLTNSTSTVGNVLDTVLPTLFQQLAGSDVYPDGSGQKVNGFTAPRTFIQDTTLSSAFAQLTWNIDDQTRLTLGGRYSSEEKTASRVLDFADLNGNSLPFDDLFLPNTTMGVDYILGQVLRVARHDLDGYREETEFAPSAILERDFASDSMAYLSWSRGFKSGGFDVRSNAPPEVTMLNPAFPAMVPAGTFAYDQEQAETVEAGVKSRLLDDRMEFNLAVFRTEYEDLQVSIFDGSLGFNVGNAASAVSQGMELDGRLAVNDNLTLIGSLALLDFEFKDYPNGQCTQRTRITTGEDLCDFSGMSNQYVADITGFLSADYQMPVTDNLFANAVLDIVYSSDYNPSQNLDPNVEQN